MAAKNQNVNHSLHESIYSDECGQSGPPKHQKINRRSSPGDHELRRSHRQKSVQPQQYDTTYHPLDPFIKRGRPRILTHEEPPLLMTRADTSKTGKTTASISPRYRSEPRIGRELDETKSSAKKNAVHQSAVFEQAGPRRSSRRIPDGPKPIYDRLYHPTDDHLRPAAAARHRLRQHVVCDELGTELKVPQAANSFLVSEGRSHSSPDSTHGHLELRHRQMHRTGESGGHTQGPEQAEDDLTMQASARSSSSSPVPQKHTNGSKSKESRNSSHSRDQPVATVESDVAPAFSSLKKHETRPSIRPQPHVKIDSSKKHWLMYISEGLDVYERDAGIRYFRHYRESLQQPSRPVDDVREENVGPDEPFPTAERVHTTPGLQSMDPIAPDLDDTHNKAQGKALPPQIMRQNTAAEAADHINVKPLPEALSGSYLNDHHYMTHSAGVSDISLLVTHESLRETPRQSRSFRAHPAETPTFETSLVEDANVNVTTPVILTGNSIPARWGTGAPYIHSEQGHLDYGSESESGKSSVKNRKRRKSDRRINIHEDWPGSTPKQNLLHAALHAGDVLKENVEPTDATDGPSQTQTVPMASTEHVPSFSW